MELQWPDYCNGCQEKATGIVNIYGCKYLNGHQERNLGAKTSMVWPKSSVWNIVCENWVDNDKYVAYEDWDNVRHPCHYCFMKLECKHHCYQTIACVNDSDCNLPDHRDLPQGCGLKPQR